MEGACQGMSEQAKRTLRCRDIEAHSSALLVLLPAALLKRLALAVVVDSPEGASRPWWWLGCLCIGLCPWLWRWWL